MKVNTLEELERRFNINKHHGERVIKLKSIIEHGFEDVIELTQNEIGAYIIIINHLEYLLSADVTHIDRIIAIIKHVSWKAQLISFITIKDETDVIIHWMEKSNDEW